MKKGKSMLLRLEMLLQTGIILSMISASRVESWPGFEWDSWKEITGSQRLDLKTPQAGRPDLLPLLSTGIPNDSPISSIAKWEQKRSLIYQTLTILLGKPSQMVVDPPDVKFLGEEEFAEYTRRHIHITGEAGDPIPAYLLIPKPFPTQPGPAVIVLHQTQAPGKQEAVGMTGNPEMAFGQELVLRGYVVLAYDVIGFGERIPEGGQPYDGAMTFFERHPKWSFFGKMGWDFKRTVDYLETLPMVDPRRIATIGHSHGAYGAIMCSIYETRIAATIASCGVATIRTDTNPDRWSKLTALIPVLGYHCEDIPQTPIDWHEILSCLAPRPFYNLSTLDDEIFPSTENLPEVFGQLKSVYQLYEKETNLESHIIPGKHQFPKEYREKAYLWLDHKLRL